MKSLAGFLVAKALADQSNADQITNGVGAGLLIVFSLIWSQVHLWTVSNRLQSPKDAGTSQPSGTPPVASLIAFTLLSLALCSGCVTYTRSKTTTSVANGVTNILSIEKERLWSGYIIESATRTFGVDVAYQPTSTSPAHVKIGFGSEILRLTPTETNTVFVPRTTSDFEVSNSLNPFDTGIKDKSSTGDVSMGTNTDSIAIIPK